MYKPAAVSNPAVGTGPHPVAKPRPAYVPAPETAPAPSAISAPTPPAGPSPRDVRDAHDRYANLEARADAALAGVDQIRSQQRAQGLDIRTDILGAMNRLHHQLAEAQRALGQRDLDTANEYMDRTADLETTRLEKFLGH